MQFFHKLLIIKYASNMQYVVSCLRFLFNAKMYLFISRCRRHRRVKISPGYYRVVGSTTL